MKNNNFPEHVSGEYIHGALTVSRYAYVSRLLSKISMVEDEMRFQNGTRFRNESNVSRYET